MDVLRQPCEKLESANRPDWGQELPSPAANLVHRIELMAFDILAEVPQIIDTKGDAARRACRPRPDSRSRTEPRSQGCVHAWPEAFLPGVGWRGFDPTHGLAVTDGHVALCAAPDQAATMPIEGGFYGDAVASTREYDVQIATG